MPGEDKRIIGIDPGARGAVAVITRGKVVDIADMPITEVKGKARVDASRLSQLLAVMNGDHAFLERVGAMPGQGVSSMFAFGQALGIVQGVLGALCIPLTWTPPVQWKAALRVPAAKDGARRRASELLPAAAHYWPRVKDDGRAEAALIALYGSQSMGLVKAAPPFSEPVRAEGSAIDW
jgi:crossover junction endodeoxyribonuclease RuvC